MSTIGGASFHGERTMANGGSHKPEPKDAKKPETKKPEEKK